MNLVAVVDRVTQLVEQGRKNSTYKLAVLIGLLDLCLEGSGSSGLPPTSVTTRQLAEKVVALYWPQVRYWRKGHDAWILAQNQGKQGLILREVEKLRMRSDAEVGRGGKRLGAGSTIGRVRLALKPEYDAVVEAVEWTLVQQPLPKLQRVSGRDTEWLYVIDWDDGAHKPKRREVLAASRRQPSGFDNTIRFKPGVAEAFARFHTVLRPYVEQRWVAEVARMNELEVGKLHAFLFGGTRSDLLLARRPLLRIQGERCFYCEATGQKKWQVDHFLPWSRFADDALSNLVVACSTCNRAKSDHLAGPRELARWRSRPEEHLKDLADDLTWELASDRTLGTVRLIYRRLPEEPWLWSGRSRQLEQVDPRELDPLLD